MTAPPPGGVVHVVFALLPDSLVLDWAGPAEALRIANQRLRAQGLPERFVLRFAGPAPEAATSVGVHVAGLLPLAQALPPAPPDAPAPTTWLVLVGLPGRTVAVDNAPARALLHWLRGLRLAAGRLELLTVCAGTLLAAHAGLLPGRRVTTHHHHLDELRAVEPACDVVDNRVFVEDPPVYSSAGVTTGIDLLLHRIAACCGEAIAAQVAQAMAVGLRRGPHDPELSPLLAHRSHLHPALHRLQDAIARQPQADWSVPRMAEVAHVSPRHLARLFMLHAQIAPLAYVRRIRLALAQRALQAGHGVQQAAALAGFASDTQLRRTWQRFGPAGPPSGRRTRPGR